jgi:predicted HicB family RNase H-like nuclease
MPTPKPKKMGRPVLPKGHAKSLRLQVRLNEDEQKKVSAKAKASKQTVSEWVRSILRAAMEA